MQYVMRKIFLLILLSFWVIQSSIGQDKIYELNNDLRSILQDGQYSFNILKVKRNNPSNNSKKIDPEEIENEFSDSDFQKLVTNDDAEIDITTTGVIKFQISTIDSIIELRAIAINSFPIVSINLKSNIAKINNQELEFDRKVIVNDSNNILESKWNGFRWKIDRTTSTEIIKYKFTVGRIENSGKIYIEITGLNFEQSTWKENYNIRLRS